MKKFYYKLTFLVDKLIKLKWLSVIIIIGVVFLLIPIALIIVLFALPFVLIYLLYETHKKYKFQKWYLSKISEKEEL
jgi:hypothetical protein